MGSNFRLFYTKIAILFQFSNFRVAATAIMRELN